MAGKIYIALLFFGLTTFVLNGQDSCGNFNPFLNAGKVSPAPIWPVSMDGSGFLSFNVGNTGSDPLHVYQDKGIEINIVLSGLLPGNSNPLNSVGGTFAGMFTWSFESGVYKGIQKSTIPALSKGSIEVSFRISEDSDFPGLNGFDAYLKPAPNQEENNSVHDDHVSSFTYAEARDYGDAPSSYGSAYHVLNFSDFLGLKVDAEFPVLYSLGASGDDESGEDDEDGVIFPDKVFQGEDLSLPVIVRGTGRLNTWIDWNGDGDFNDAQEQVAENIPVSNEEYPLKLLVPEYANLSDTCYARFRLSPGLLNLSQGGAMGGEVEDYALLIYPADQTPEVPTGFQIGSLSDSAVLITWDPPAVEDNISGYNVYRDDILVASTGTPEYLDVNVVPGMKYGYSASSMNMEGYESERSTRMYITIPYPPDEEDIEAPTVPTGVMLYLPSPDKVELSWEASFDNVGVKGYKIYRNGTFYSETSLCEYIDEGLMAGDFHAYSVSAFDAAGNESAQSMFFSVYIRDYTPPTVPRGLELLSAESDSVVFSWNPSTDDMGLSCYAVYKDGIFMKKVKATICCDTTGILEYPCTYAVSAIDKAGNESKKSGEIRISPAFNTGMQINQLYLYPNPATDIVFLEIEKSMGEAIVEIMSLRGVIHIQEIITLDSGNISLDVSNLLPGIYFVRLKLKGQSYIKELVKIW